MKVFSKFASAAALLIASAPLATQATESMATDEMKAQSCLNAFVDQYLPGQSPVAKLDSADSDHSLAGSRRFEMALTATRDGRVIATALCKVEEGVTSITKNHRTLIAAN